MDRTRRTFAKAFSWQLIGLITMTGLGTIFTGSAGVAGGLALTSAALGTLCFRPVYRCDKPNLMMGLPRCMTFGGPRVDAAIAWQ